MSLICLSSRGLSDSPNNYTNYFGGRGIEFPKNSEICLVGSSIRKHAPGRAMVTLTGETNTFACHYGADGVLVNDNLFRDDVFTQTPITDTYIGVAEALGNTIKDQCTISPLRYGVTSTIAGAGWTLQMAMTENRTTEGGRWAVPNNLPFEAPVVAVNTATDTTLTPETGVSCWSQDTRKLWNVDNQATLGVFATELEGVRFDIYMDRGQSRF